MPSLPVQYRFSSEHPGPTSQQNNTIQGDEGQTNPQNNIIQGNEVEAEVLTLPDAQFQKQLAIKKLEESNRELIESNERIKRKIAQILAQASPPKTLRASPPPAPIPSFDPSKFQAFTRPSSYDITIPNPGRLDDGQSRGPYYPQWERTILDKIAESSADPHHDESLVMAYIYDRTTGVAYSHLWPWYGNGANLFKNALEMVDYLGWVIMGSQYHRPSP